MTNLEALRAQLPEFSFRWLDNKHRIAEFTGPRHSYLIQNYEDDGFDIYKLIPEQNLDKLVLKLVSQNTDYVGHDEKFIRANS